MAKNHAEFNHRREGIERLIRLYEAWEKPDKAAVWKQNLKAFGQAERGRQPARATAGEK